MTIIDATYIPDGTTLHINPGGLEGSERMAKDGFVLFGTKNVKQTNTGWVSKWFLSTRRRVHI